ncbi:hypothetical protein GC174_08700 [bacterium]|nr:hypothetical protein [bacterium]
MTSSLSNKLQTLNPASTLVRSLKESTESLLNLRISEADRAERLSSPAGLDAGQLITMSNNGGFRLVYVYLHAAAPVAMDSHMIYVFAPYGSLIPHFTVDAVAIEPPGSNRLSFGFHCDLIPRLSADSEFYSQYIEAVYSGLVEAKAKIDAVEGIVEATLKPEQVELMSPHMVAAHSGEEAFAALSRLAVDYFDHWAALVGDPSCFATSALRRVPELSILKYDGRMRKRMFSPEIDPVWDRILPLVGEQNRSKIIDCLVDAEPVAKPFHSFAL